MSEAEKTTAATKSARKTTAKAETADVFAMGSTEIPEIFRDVTEKSVKQARETYEKIRSAAEEASDLLEDQYETTRTGFLALHVKAVDAAKANSDAVFSFFKDALAVKTFAEALELQTSFARQQFDLFSAQAKEMQELVQKVSADVAAPMKDSFSKLVKDMNAA